MADGQISANCIEPLETCCIQAMSAAMPVYLFLRDVSIVDRSSGYALLERLAERGGGLGHGCHLHPLYSAGAKAESGWSAVIQSSGA